MKKELVNEVITPSLNFAKEVMKLSGENVYLCFQCGTCSGSCPFSSAMDNTPRQIIRMVQLGLKDEVFSSYTIWLCASCYTCTVRCPRGIKITEVMSALKSMAINEGIEVKSKSPIFEIVKKYGRLHEAELMQKFALKGGKSKVEFLKDISLGLNFLMKGKLSLHPHKIKHVKDIEVICNNVQKEMQK